MGATVKDRLLEYISYKGIEKARFEKDAKLSNGFVDKVGDTMRSTSLDKIRENFPDLNINWLLTGEGVMLKGVESFKNEVIPVAESDYMMVEYVDLRVSAGKLGVGCVDQLPETHKRLVPKEFDNGKFLIVRVDGDSMDDGSKRSLSDGDEVLIYLNEDGLFGGLPIRKTVFVITTRDGNILKQIAEINREEKYIVCRSFNSQHEDFKVKFDDIFQIFTVCKVVNRQISLT